MSYHTLEDEKRSELIDKTIQSVGELVLLLLNARTEEQLAKDTRATSVTLLSGRTSVACVAVPCIDALRQQIDTVHELLEKVECELVEVNARVQERYQRSYNERQHHSEER